MRRLTFVLFSENKKWKNSDKFWLGNGISSILESCKERYPNENHSKHAFKGVYFKKGRLLEFLK